MDQTQKGTFLSGCFQLLERSQNIVTVAIYQQQAYLPSMCTVWLGLGTETTWLGLGRHCGLGLKLCAAFLALCLSSSLITVTITSATRGHHRTRKDNMCHNKLLSQSTSVEDFLDKKHGNMVWHVAEQEHFWCKKTLLSRKKNTVLWWCFWLARAKLKLMWDNLFFIITDSVNRWSC